MVHQVWINLELPSKEELMKNGLCPETLVLAARNNLDLMKDPDQLPVLFQMR